MNKLHIVAQAIADAPQKSRSKLLENAFCIEAYSSLFCNQSLNLKESEKIQGVLQDWYNLIKRGIVKASTVVIDFEEHVIKRLNH